MPFHQANFVNRANFGPFLNERGLNGNGVEIGTYRGDFARALLLTWKCHRLFCVDPWIAGYDPEDPASPTDMEEAERVARSHLDGRHDVRILKRTSLEAYAEFCEGCLDFVYIDGNHQPGMVRLDLHLWWPRLKLGGILAGHDIVCPGEIGGGFGRYIQKEVVDFANLIHPEQAKMGIYGQLEIYFVVEEDGSPWSYYIEKPKP